MPSSAALGEGAAISLLSFPCLFRDSNTAGTRCDTLLCSGTCHPISDVWMSPRPSPLQSVPSSATPKLWWERTGAFGVGLQGGMWGHVRCPLICHQPLHTLSVGTNQSRRALESPDQLE